MESLANLHTLASSLPTAQQNAEKELTNNFRAAALSITTLYRSSKKNSKRAYNAGYAAACQDLLTMIQQGVSLDPGTSGVDGSGMGMGVGRVMDWLEARMEAIHSREEEEEEEEERERERDGGKEGERKTTPTTSTTTTTTTSDTTKTLATAGTQQSPVMSIPRPKAGQPITNPPLPIPSSQPNQHQHPPSEHSSSPPPIAALRPIQRPITSRPRPLSGKPDISNTTHSSGSLDLFTDTVPSSTSPVSEYAIPLAGAKRRHAMMMMLDPPSAEGTSTQQALHVQTTITSSGSGRRRPRRHNHGHSQNQALSVGDAMDVVLEEEGGRERKRVARR